MSLMSAFQYFYFLHHATKSAYDYLNDSSNKRKRDVELNSHQMSTYTLRLSHRNKRNSFCKLITHKILQNMTAKTVLQAPLL
ncbi:CLUMA_CG005846, isoform A [Clunio marinus]|uniref:CLUMA_CG005846, isoform A n=1 Tax=Clunio marinus TaxID=568069 RepID=A0A1J1HVX1_9DIPT|nr:CLUMA_CG005846, isoform A [Clunio marinus]